MLTDIALASNIVGASRWVYPEPCPEPVEGETEGLGMTL
jgi:hypothetical protein